MSLCLREQRWRLPVCADLNFARWRARVAMPLLQTNRPSIPFSILRRQFSPMNAGASSLRCSGGARSSRVPWRLLVAATRMPLAGAAWTDAAAAFGLPPARGRLAAVFSAIVLPATQPPDLYQFGFVGGGRRRDFTRCAARTFFSRRQRGRLDNDGWDRMHAPDVCNL